MTSHRPMTIEEKLDTGIKAIELEKAGDKEGASRLMKTIPMPPYLAKVNKKFMGADFLINEGYNLVEAETEFGPGWLDT